MASPIIAAVLSLFVYSTSAFPHGAPPDICVTNLVPSHGGNRPQPSTGPYTIVASSRTYSPGKPITVILKGSGQSFKGFAIQAQDFQTGEPILNGEWRGTGIKQLPCGAVTHTSPASKTKVEVTWVPKGSGEVIFLATVVETYDTFYVGIKSSSTRNRGTATNSFYDQKTRASASYATNVDDQDAYQSPAVSASEDTNSYYDDVSNSQAKEDDGETADTQAQYDTNYYSPYDPNSGYSQPDFSATSSSAVSGPAAQEQVSEGQQPQDQNSYYSQSNYQFQTPPWQQAQQPVRPQQQQQQQFASFQSPSYHSQQFAPPPNYRRPFQPFRAFWNYPRF
ncbi:hypothetical protein CHUAL_010969 [Chamberlinius hualienensis]